VPGHVKHSWMVDFFTDMKDRTIADRMLELIEGAGAFNRFREQLNAMPSWRTRWHDYDRKCATAWFSDWLQREGIETGTPQVTKVTREAASHVYSQLLVLQQQTVRLLEEQNKLLQRHESASADADESTKVDVRTLVPDGISQRNALKLAVELGCRISNKQVFPPHGGKPVPRGHVNEGKQASAQLIKFLRYLMKTASSEQNAASQKPAVV
jgi:Uncharacterised protein family (UPF0158)